MSYPTDRELEQWIEQLEQEELYAPRHLKEEILFKADEQGSGDRSSEDKKRKDKQNEFLIYSFKVIGSMAAALVLLLVLPTGNIQQKNIPTQINETQEDMVDETQREEREGFNHKMKKGMNILNEMTTDFCKNLNQKTNLLISEGFIHED